MRNLLLKQSRHYETREAQIRDGLPVLVIITRNISGEIFPGFCHDTTIGIYIIFKNLRTQKSPHTRMWLKLQRFYKAESPADKAGDGFFFFFFRRLFEKQSEGEARFLTC